MCSGKLSRDGKMSAKLNFLPPPPKESVGKINEVKNANFSFNKKSYVDALLQKVRAKECATKMAI